MPIFQDPLASLDERWPLWRTITEPLMAGPRQARPTRATRRTHAGQALARVGLAHLDIDTLPGQLSVGRAQRIAIIRALAASILALLRTVAQAGTAIVVVSHDQDTLTVLADHVLTMTTGCLDLP